MTLNPRYGMIGFLSFPYFWLVECLGPLVELGGYIYIVIAFFLGKFIMRLHSCATTIRYLWCYFSIAAILFESWSMNTYPKKESCYA